MSNDNTLQNNTDLKNHHTQAENAGLDDVNKESKQKVHKWNASFFKSRFAFNNRELVIRTIL